jgi:site-specific DNA recombinase
MVDECTILTIYTVKEGDMYRGYARVSTEGQSDNSIENQLKYLKIQSDKLGEDFTPYFEKQSGKALEHRTMLRKLISELKDGDVVGVYDNSRLGRNTEENLNIAKQIIDKKARLQVNGKIVDIDNPNDKLMLTIESAVSTYQRENQLLKSKIGIETKKEKGQWIFTGKLLGYDVIRKNGNITVSINKEGAEVVRYIYKRFNDGASFNEITEEINSKGYRTAKGSLYNPAAIRRFIFKPIYMGYYIPESLTIDRRYAPGYAQVQRISKNELVKSVYYPPIFDEDYWWKTYRRYLTLDKRHVRKGNARFTRALLSGLLRCKQCDTGYFRTDKTNEANAPTHPVYYQNRTHDKSICDLEVYTFHAPVMDDIFENCFVLLFLFESDLFEHEQKQKQEYTETIQLKMADIDRLEGLLEEADNKIENLMKAVEKGLDIESVIPRIKSIEDDKKKIKLDLQKAQIEKINTEEDLEELIEWKSIEALDRYFNVPIRDKRSIMREFFPIATVSVRTITIETNINVTFQFDYHKTTKVYLQQEFEIQVHKNGKYLYTLIHDRSTKDIEVKDEGKRQAQEMLKSRIKDLFDRVEVVKKQMLSKSGDKK